MKLRLRTALTATQRSDPLGNLHKVDQSGRIRTFAYDALSRLVCASNPENSTVGCSESLAPLPPAPALIPGTTWYTYSNSSTNSACSPDPSSPCTRTDARGIVTSTTALRGLSPSLTRHPICPPATSTSGRASTRQTTASPQPDRRPADMSTTPVVTHSSTATTSIGTTPKGSSAPLRRPMATAIPLARHTH